MRKFIEKYAEGFFEENSFKLQFSVNKIEESLPSGSIKEGTFVLSSEDEEEFSARIFSSDMRLVCRIEQFVGSSVTIPYVFDSTGLEAGDVIKGDIRVVSSVGEYYLPFIFSITYGLVKSSLGNVRNLFHFANQAQTNWEEAVALFYSPSFKQVFSGNDRIHYDKYRGFSNLNGNPQSVDDFICSVNKKRPVVYSVDRNSIEFNDVSDVYRCEFLLHKSTWGHVSVELSTDVSFIRLEKDRLCGSDFLGNSHALTFYILGDNLHEGRNFGCITIKSGYQELNVSILARHRARTNTRRIERREKRNLNIRLMRRYIEFRMKKTNVNTWVRESMKIVERLNALDEKNPVSRLFQVQLLTVQRRENEAKWILDHVENQMQIRNSSRECYAYFLYLKSLLNRDNEYIDQIAMQVAALYETNQGSAEILWTLLYLDEELSSNASKKLSLIEKQFDRGCTSPILYIEAYNIFAGNPEKLTKLNSFEIQILMFALKQDVISKDLLRQFIYIAGKLRSYSDMVMKLLCLCYDVTGEDDLVEIICSLLIKGNLSGSKYFKWFEKAVNLQLRITKLYEYYMYSIPAQYDGMISKSVLMYFGFRNDMNYRKIAFMYANLIRHKRENQESYETYRQQMQVFALEQIDFEHIDSNLAVIYEDLLLSEMIKPAMASHLAKILFAHEIRVDDPLAKNVVLIQEEFEEEMIFPVENGFAYPTIYSMNYTLFTEDSYKRRRLISSDNVRKILNEAVYIPAIRFYVSDNVYFAMYMCAGRRHFINVEENNVDFCRSLAQSPKVSELYKRDIRMALIHYYYDNDQVTTLDEFLVSLDVKILSSKDRADVIKFMVRRGMFERAYELITIYGVEEVSPKVCVRVCSHMIEEKEQLKDVLLVKLCYHAFVNGKYNEVTLKYLVDNYEGLTKELRNIWKAANDFEVDSYRLMERILVQLLFTRTCVGEKDQIFDQYNKAGASGLIKLAYLSYNAYEYFAKERLTDDRVFAHIVDMVRLEEPINDACRLALLKYYAEEEVQYTEKIKEMLKSFLVDFMHRNTYFKFFEKYAGLVPEISDYMDKTIIEYRTSPNTKVSLHYFLEEAKEGQNEYHVEEMRNMYGGIFSREFILFFGENLQYYITEEHAGKEIFTASDSVTISETASGVVESRYTMINDMVVSQTVQDDDTLMELMKDYVEADCFAKKVFKIR